MKRAIPVLMILLCSLGYTVTVVGQDIRKMSIAVHFKNASLEEVLQQLETLTKCKFNYRTKDIAAVKGINYQDQHVNAGQLLKEILGKANLEFEQVKDYIIIKKQNSYR